MTTLTAVPAAPVPPCVRYPGFRQGEFAHPEGACACFAGGPAPVRTLSPLEEVLRQAAIAQAADARPRQEPRRRPLGRRAA